MNIRSFTHTETAFLAYVYGYYATVSPGERYDTTVQWLLDEWQEQTGETLDADFHKFAIQVYASQ